MKPTPVTRIVLFDDNPDYGGHQVMTNHALEGVLRLTDWQVMVLGDPDNAKSQAAWQALQREFAERLRIEASPTRTRKFQSVRNFYERATQRRLLEQLHAFGPDLVLCSQGNIEQCSAIFPLRGRIGCPLISYIPLPHGHAEMGAKLGRLRDAFCRPLFRHPDGFITLSPTLAQALRAKGARGRVEVVANGIPVDKFAEHPDHVTARVALRLPESGFHWLLPGRTEFKQKGQDFAIEVFLLRKTQLPDEHLVLLGSGPDSAKLAELAANIPNVHLLPWTDEPARVLAAADALILPSRYEGVPLVMLEALACGRPVCATDRDGMRDWLPAEWRFHYRDSGSASRAMDALRRDGKEQLFTLQQRVRSSHSIEDFQRDFVSALASWIPAAPVADAFQPLG